RWIRTFDDHAQRREVSLRDPAQELQTAFVEKADLRSNLADREQFARGDLAGGAEDPSRRGASAERHRDEASDARARAVGPPSGEGTIEREQRDRDADVDRTREDRARGGF